MTYEHLPNSHFCLEALFKDRYDIYKSPFHTYQNQQV